MVRMVITAIVLAALGACAGPAPEPAPTSPPASASDAVGPSTDLPPATSDATAVPEVQPGTSGGPGAAPAQPDALAQPSGCRAGTLTVTLGPPDGAAGTVYRALRFTNTGSSPCVLRGFPGVSYLDRDGGTQVGPAAARDGAPGGPVTLAPRATASATLAMVTVANFEPARCGPRQVAGLRVYPPGDTASAFVAATGTGCARDPGQPQLRVGSVEPGSGRR